MIFAEGQEPTTGLFGAPTRFGRLRALVKIFRAISVVERADAAEPAGVAAVQQDAQQQRDGAGDV